MGRKILNKNEYSKLTEDIGTYFTILEERVKVLEEDKIKLLQEKKDLERQVMQLKGKNTFGNWIKNLFGKKGDYDQEKFNTNPIDSTKIQEALQVKEPVKAAEKKVQIEEKVEASYDFSEVLEYSEKRDYEGFNNKLEDYLNSGADFEEIFENLLTLPLENRKILEILVEVLKDELLFHLFKEKKGLFFTVKQDDFTAKIKLKLLKVLFIYRMDFSEIQLRDLLKDVISNISNYAQRDSEILVYICITLYNIKDPAELGDLMKVVSKNSKEQLMGYFSMYRDGKRAKEYSRALEQYMNSLDNSLNNKVRKSALKHMGNCVTDIIISQKL